MRFPPALLLVCSLALVSVPVGAAARTVYTALATTEPVQGTTSTTAILQGYFTLPCDSDFGFKIRFPDDSIRVQTWHHYYGVGLWNWTISDLSPGTTYSYEAYVHSSGCGDALGDAVSFTTEARLTTSVTGSGTVTGGPRPCASECEDDVPNGQPLTLTATPQPGNVFVGWSGICARQGPVCTATPTGT
ncbi:MAG: Divergent InlB B-repeat domain, partial [Solirubrobacteraceae bacterium]|nr:Divergent InlB B-repeat domain [Solirubrobacteraceae bacterium]